MLLRLRFGNAPHVAAILLLLGIVLGGAVDAVACEPTIEIAAATAIAAEPDILADAGTRDQAPGQERHGDCIHGHCHHGAQQVPPLAVEIELPMVSVEHVTPGENDLSSIPPGTFKRPPRA